MSRSRRVRTIAMLLLVGIGVSLVGLVHEAASADTGKLTKFKSNDPDLQASLN